MSGTRIRGFNSFTFRMLLPASFAILYPFIEIMAVDHHPLWEVQNEFKKEKFNLKGSVFSAKTYKLRPVYHLGELVSNDTISSASYFFDENGNITKLINKSRDVNSKCDYSFWEDSVLLVIENRHGDLRNEAVVYKRDSKGRITEAKYYNENKPIKRIVFDYTPNGYDAVTFEGNKKSGYQKNGNKFIAIYEMGRSTGTLNSSGQEVTCASKHILGGSNTVNTYNNNGDLVTSKDNERLGIKNYTAVKHESGDRYKYVYDDLGNWIEKRTYHNGKLEDDYEVREIVYKSPDEIIAEKKAEAERTRAFEEELQRKGEEYAKTFVEDYYKQNFKKALVSHADHYLKNSVPIAGFSVSNDTYSFDLSDGTKVSDIKFEKINYEGSWDNLISSDLHLVLIPKYTQDGPKWYVVKYGAIADFDFDPAHSTDWEKLYRAKYRSQNNVSDEEIKKLWKKELDHQWSDSKYSDISQRIYRMNKDSICVNELVDAYDKGFVSPSASNKKEETECIEAYEKRKADERRKNLCYTAYSACSFKANGKPDADKLKKFTCNGSVYNFKKKDNTEIENLTFDTELSGGGVYLSSDQTVALVCKRRYTDIYLFIVELDGDNVKSVNFISPKDTKDFTPPMNVGHIYRM